MSRNGIKLGVVVLAPVVCLAVLEVGFRWRAHARNRDTLESAFSIPSDEVAVARTRFLDIIQPHPSDKIIYELRPDLDVDYKGQLLATNRHGFRGEDYPVEAPEGTLTVVGIGASIMFGHGVPQGEEYAALLERALRAKFPSAGWRFVNTSVPSYNVVMKVETLKEKGLAFDPDVVLLNVAGNNLDLPNYIRVVEDPYDLGRSFLLDFVGEIRRRVDETESRNTVLARVDKDKLSWGNVVQTDPEKIPPEYRGLVGWDPFFAAMDELAALRDEHGFEVIVFTTLELDVTSRMLRAAEERGFHAVSLMPDLVAYMEEARPDEGFTLEGYAASKLVVSPTNLHPSSYQHHLAAKRLLAAMDELGVVERLLE